MKQNTCIRVLADVNQIKQCRDRIESIDGSLYVLGNVLNLTGNDVRLKILFLLQEEGQLCPCDLSDILGMNISPISQHLRKLKDGKVVVTKKTGQTIFYSINPAYTDIFKSIFKLLNSQKILEMV